MKKEHIFWLAIFCSFTGPTILGLGIGKLFDRPCVGIAIGIGTGLSIIALYLFKIFRRIEAFDKKA